MSNTAEKASWLVSAGAQHGPNPNSVIARSPRMSEKRLGGGDNMSVGPQPRLRLAFNGWDFPMELRALFYLLVNHLKYSGND